MSARMNRDEVAEDIARKAKYDFQRKYKTRMSIMQLVKRACLQFGKEIDANK